VAVGSCASGRAALLCARESSADHDFRDAGLEPVEVALMALAESVAIDAHRVKESDIGRPRTFGVSDDEIFGVVLAAAARSFYSKSLGAMGCPPSPELADTNGLIDLAGGEAPEGPLVA
jgi:alkylhydroperoxidase family enzyme